MVGGIAMVASLRCFLALGITAILAIMEISLSFDNAVVNASILKGWNDFLEKDFF